VATGITNRLSIKMHIGIAPVKLRFSRGSVKKRDERGPQGPKKAWTPLIGIGLWVGSANSLQKQRSPNSSALGLDAGTGWGLDGPTGFTVRLSADGRRETRIWFGYGEAT